MLYLVYKPVCALAPVWQIHETGWLSSSNAAALNCDGVRVGSNQVKWEQTSCQKLSSLPDNGHVNAPTYLSISTSHPSVLVGPRATSQTDRKVGTDEGNCSIRKGIKPLRIYPAWIVHQCVLSSSYLLYIRSFVLTVGCLNKLLMAIVCALTQGQKHFGTS